MVTGSTVAIVTVVVGPGAVVAGAAVVATVVVVAPLMELPHPAIPNAAATRITENARRRGTRFPFEVPASTIGSPQTSSRTGITGKPRRLRNGSRMPTTWDFRHARNMPTPPEDCPIGTANDPWRDM